MIRHSLPLILCVSAIATVIVNAVARSAVRVLGGAWWAWATIGVASLFVIGALLRVNGLILR